MIDHILIFRKFCFVYLLSELPDLRKSKNVSDRNLIGWNKVRQFRVIIFLNQFFFHKNAKIPKDTSTIFQKTTYLIFFPGTQTRLVVVVDGLDSCEQSKVLSVLDAVHMLFSDEGSPFIILLAIDPHVVSKAVEINIHQVCPI